MLAAYSFFEIFEHLLQALDLSLGLLEMRFEGFPELRRSCRLGELRQRFGELPLGIVGVAQFVDERIVQGSGFSHVDFSVLPSSSSIRSRPEPLSENRS